MAAYTPALSMAKPKDRARRPPRPASPRSVPSEPSELAVGGLTPSSIEGVVAKTEADGEVPSGPPLLFCPFCRECYEGETLCPEHDLKLVVWDDLPHAEEPEELTEDHEVSPVDLRFGRGELGAGVLLLLASVLAPMFTVSEGRDSSTFSLLEAATSRAPNLWTIPFVAALVLSITLRRRSIGQMLGARLAMLILSTGPFLSLVYTMWKIYGGAAQLSAAMHLDVQVHLEWGIGLIVAGGVLLVIGSLRLGVAPKVPRPKDQHERSPIG
jgi:hypothetical protein